MIGFDLPGEFAYVSGPRPKDRYYSNLNHRTKIHAIRSWCNTYTFFVRYIVKTGVSRGCFFFFFFFLWDHRGCI